MQVPQTCRPLGGGAGSEELGWVAREPGAPLRSEISVGEGGVEGFLEGEQSLARDSAVKA